jgi:uroporphyrinogen-III synthase
MQPLDGVGVLVTRPEQQAMPLCRLLEAQGARSLRLAAIEIRAYGDRQALHTISSALEDFDLIVFTSVNAVRFGAGLLEQRRDLNIAAIGPATARALNQAGYRVAIKPTEGYDSEGLLAHAKLKNLAARRILLIKGRGGRHLLEQEFKTRGAHVARAEVYERVAATPSAAALSAILASFEAGEINAITATSVDIGIGLLALANPRLREAFERSTWVVPAERVAAELRRQGLKAPLLIAASAEDQDLVAALLQWRSDALGIGREVE